MKRSARPTGDGDLRWRLVDSILRRLMFLIAHLGISPSELSERVRLIASEARKSRIKQGTYSNARTFAETHSGPEIMRLWYRDLDFLDESGNPKRLPVEGLGASFERLVSRSAPGVGPANALSDLIAAGAVEVADDGRLVARSFSVVVSGSARRAEMALYSVDNLLASVHTNVRSVPSAGTLQREAVCVRFDRKQLARIPRHLTQQCVATLEQSDDWLHQHRVPADSKARDAVTVVVGMYVTIREGDKPSLK
jgi:hypothetical protein